MCEDDGCIEKSISYINSDTICSIETEGMKTINEVNQNREGFEKIEYKSTREQ